MPQEENLLRDVYEECKKNPDCSDQILSDQFLEVLHYRYIYDKFEGDDREHKFKKI